MAANPTSDETNPDSSLLIYDGDCGFCTNTAKWVSRRNSKTKALPWQSVDYETYGLTKQDVSSAAYWVAEDGSVHRGHSAINQSLKASGGIYSALGRIGSLPPFSWMSRFIYKIIAKYRHRLPGSTDNCRMD